MFKGSITALITPFKNGAVDWKAFENLIEWQIDQGTHGVVPCGTTGESPTLSHEEHMAIVERCVQVVNKKIPVIAGTGSNSTKEAVDFTEHAKKAGADGCLSVVPYYNKPTQEGMYQHFKAVGDAGLPVILYNIPGRSVVDMNMDTVERLSKLPHIVGIKDATNDLGRPTEMRERLGKNFCLLSAEDGTAAGYLAQGGDGIISVVSNVAPKLSAQMQNDWQAGKLDGFAEARDLLAPLTRALFCESSPSPVKYAASLLDLSSDEVRLPLLPASENARKLVTEAMKHAKLLG